MREFINLVTILVVILLAWTGSACAQRTDLEGEKWLLGVTLKLERMKDATISDIQRYEGEIRKCNATIGKCENIIRLARQKGNAAAEKIAGRALAKARQAKLKNEKLKNSAAVRKKRTATALRYVQTGDKDLEAKTEQVWFENMNADWMEKQRQLIDQRLREPNKWCSGIHGSLLGKAPPLPYKKFDKLQTGDVLLIAGGWPITAADNFLSGDKVSDSSHTVSYLKEVNGKKLFLDNQPGKGPRIISEEVFLEKYGHRGGQVARLIGQPLNEQESKQLFTASVEMAQKNRKEIANKWFGTNYGTWGKDNVVCSEADWALLKATGREIPKSGDQTKVELGIDFSPADYRNQQYFLVTPLSMPKQSAKEK
jgi:hypothetical protein